MRRPLYLTGFMGAGKSTVGAELARQLGVRLIDSDAAIEAEEGSTIEALVQQRGEASLRALERRFLERELGDGSPRVIALGGGALLDRSLRLRVLESGTLVCLEASAPELRRRLGDGAGRPLLAVAGAMEGLLLQRAEAYAESHVQIPTDETEPSSVAARVAEQAARADLVVAAGKRSYPVVVSRGGGWLREHLARLAPTSVVLVSDHAVARHHAPRFARWMDGQVWSGVGLEGGEASKTVETMSLLWGALQRAEVDRRGVIVGVGGGVVTDLAGFAAGTWLRGVRWVAVPSSLLGMVDAAVGGKTAVDLGEAKNVVGVFHQPSAVCIDVDLLSTEPERSYIGGLAEVVKAALVGDATLLSWLETEAESVLARSPDVMERVVRAAVAVKVAIVSRDEHEHGERRLLNLGHTLGHALEALGGFTERTHGEAVALGMVAALRVGEQMGVTEPGLAARIEALLARLGLPHRLSEREVHDALPLMRHDKKREREEVHYVLVERAGRAQVRKIRLEELGERLLRAARESS